MARGSRQILADRVLSEIEHDQDLLGALEMPPATRMVIATELAEIHGGVWTIDVAQRNAIYELRTGERPGREERDERGNAKRPA